MVDVEISPLVTISCADYSHYVSIALRNLFDSKRGSDFDLKWDGMSIRAHRIILELFLSTETMGCPVQDPVAVKQEVPDCDGASSNNVLESLLEFLYKGEVTVPEEHLEDLLRASKELDFKMLEDAIVQCCSTQTIQVDVEIDIKEEDVISCSEKSAPFGEPISSPDDSPRTQDDDSNNLDFAPPRVIKLFKCPQCEFESLINRNYRLHLLNVHGVNSKGEPVPKKKCPLCKFETSAAWNYRRHLVSSHGIDEKGEPAPKQKCPHCEYETSATTTFRRHLVRDHGINIKGLPAPKRKCPHCEYETSIVQNYRQHLLRSHGTNTKGQPAPKRKCSHCEYETSVFDSYRQHLVKRHGIDTKGEPAQNHKCQHCDFESISYYKFCNHLLATHNITLKGKPAPTYKCAPCQYETSSKSAYRYHSVSVHGKTIKGEPAPMHKCPQCDFSTAFVCRLNRHKILHSQETSYACEHCSYAGKTKESLDRHLFISHGVGSSSFTCEVCHKRYFCRSELERHSWTHSTERKYKCRHCSFASNYKNDLRVHVISKH